ncbi:hypothetical protein DL767_009382 [Monosporascus sp. MG133]|nr:hypothetical protein DL767_009382 [Monosporascus sp. MG133]
MSNLANFPRPVPTFEALRTAHQPVFPTSATKRLYWTLQGPISTEIFVMDEEQNPDSPRKAYFRQTFAGTSWHPISQEALTEPKLSSITVSVDELRDWENDWLEYHRHAEPGIEGCMFEETEAEEETEADEEPELLMCCGEVRPKEHIPLVIKASEQPYLTVHDYVTALHPWLMGLRNDILQVKNMWDNNPLPPETKLAVNYRALAYLQIEEEEIRIVSMREFHQIPPFIPVPPLHLLPNPPLFNPNPI